MDHLTLVKNAFLKEQKIILDSLEKARETRDSAPSAMESHSDTTRSQYERLVFALEEKLKKIESDIKSIPDKVIPSDKANIWHYCEIQTPNGLLKVILVPPEMGGKKAEDMLIISIDSPLGSILLSKKAGDIFNFNNLPYKILEII